MCNLSSALLYIQDSQAQPVTLANKGSVGCDDVPLVKNHLS